MNAHVYDYSYHVAETKHDAHVIAHREAQFDAKCCAHVLDYKSHLRALGQS
jgi:hypothetical protein